MGLEGGRQRRSDVWPSAINLVEMMSSGVLEMLYTLTGLMVTWVYVYAKKKKVTELSTQRWVLYCRYVISQSKKKKSDGRNVGQNYGRTCVLL